MRGIVVWCCVFFLSFLLPSFLSADTKGNESTVFNEFKSIIPQGSIKTTDDLYKTWQGIQGSGSKAVILDIRTEAEFDSGHIPGSNNLDSGHAYQVPKLWPDPNTEMWVFCRTQHRATYFVGMLYKYGYKNVYLVDKGITGWIEKGYPLANKYLGEIKVIKYQHSLKESYQHRDNK